MTKKELKHLQQISAEYELTIWSSIFLEFVDNLCLKMSECRNTSMISDSGLFIQRKPCNLSGCCLCKYAKQLNNQ